MKWKIILACEGNFHVLIVSYFPARKTKWLYKTHNLKCAKTYKAINIWFDALSFVGGAKQQQASVKWQNLRIIIH